MQSSCRNCVYTIINKSVYNGRSFSRRFSEIQKYRDSHFNIPRNVFIRICCEIIYYRKHKERNTYGRQSK